MRHRSVLPYKRFQRLNTDWIKEIGDCSGMTILNSQLEVRRWTMLAKMCGGTVVSAHLLFGMRLCDNTSIQCNNGANKVSSCQVEVHRSYMDIMMDTMLTCLGEPGKKLVMTLSAHEMRWTWLWEYLTCMIEWWACLCTYEGLTSCITHLQYNIEPTDSY